MKLILCALFAVSFVSAELSVSDRIDQAIVLSESMDQQGAEVILKRLLNEELTSDERVSVLYNLASIACQRERFDEALTYFDQISRDNFEQTKQKSPFTALSISYNHAICLLKLAEKTILERSVEQYLLDAKNQLLEAKALFSVVSHKEINSSMLTHGFEVAASLLQQSTKIAFSKKIQSESKQELLSTGIDELKSLLSILHELENRAGIELYIKDIGYRYAYKVLLIFDRVLVFLHAPSSPQIAKVRDFLIDNILSLESEFRKSIEDQKLTSLLQTVYALNECLHLVANENSDVEALLQMRIDAFKQRNSFHQQTARLTLDYLNTKISVATAKESALLTRLRSEIQKAPSTVEKAERDLQFWKALQMPLDDSYSKLLSTPTTALFEAVIARLEVEQLSSAIPPLQKAKKSQDAHALILNSWYHAAPKSMLRYVVGLLAPKVKTHVLDTQLQLLLPYLGDYSKKHPQFLPAFEALQKKNTAFEQYVTLFWLFSMLQEDPSNIKELASAIKQMQVMQQDLFLALTNAPNSVPLGWRLQQSIIKNRAVHLDKSGVSKSVKPKLKQIFSQIDALLKNAPSKRASQKVSELLQEALKLLEQEEKTQSPTAKPEKKDLSLQMQKMPLKLAPETSIRLLQEMEQDDSHLFKKPLSEKEGIKPW